MQGKIYLEDDNGGCKEVESVEVVKAELINRHKGVSITFTAPERSDKDDATIISVAIDTYHKYDIVMTD